MPDFRRDPLVREGLKKEGSGGPAPIPLIQISHRSILRLDSFGKKCHFGVWGVANLTIKLDRSFSERPEITTLLFVFFYGTCLAFYHRSVVYLCYLISFNLR
jgi:hypothetical protein